MTVFAVIIGLAFAGYGSTVKADMVPDNKVKIEASAFNLSGAVTISDGQQSGSGSFTNGSVSDYPESYCIPIYTEVKNNDNVSGDILVVPSYDYYDGGYTGITDIEEITTGLTDPGAAADLDDFYYTESSISNTTYSTIEGTTITALVDGPYSGVDGTDPTGATDQFRHYNLYLQNVPAGETVQVVFCAKLSWDASEYPGASLSVRINGNENIGIQASSLLKLPKLTLTKNVVGGTATPDMWSFEVTPAINGQSVYEIPDGQSSVEIDNIQEDGTYTITEIGPAEYTFQEGTGNNCTFNSDTASASVAAGKPSTDATCTFTNGFMESTITVVKEVINDDGRMGIVGDFNLFIDAVQVESGVAAAFAPGTYTVSETNSAGYTASFSGDCDANGVVNLALGENLTCTITNDDTPQTGTITVVKVVDNGNNGTAAVGDFNLYVDQTEVNSGDANEFTAGSYTISEGDGGTGLLDDYGATFSGDCDASGNITLAEDEDLTCTITNTHRTGTITVVKVVDNGNNGTAAVGDFNLYVDQTSVNSGDANSFDVGDYVISEDDGGNGLLDDYTTAFSGDCDAAGNITLGADENLTCTITNTYQTGTITVSKVIDNGNNGTATVGDFNLFVDAAQVASGAANPFDIGSYVISETDGGTGLLNDYTATFSGDCDASGNITLGADENVTCVITNTYKTGTITVTKVIDNVNTGTATVGDFNLLVDELEVASGDTNTFDIGSYVISENDGGSGILDDYTATFSGDCDAAGNIALGADEALTCTITNTYQEPAPTTGTITVTKVVDNSDGGSAVVEDFNLFVDDVQVVSGEANEFEAGPYKISENDGDSGLLDDYDTSFSGDCNPSGHITLAAGEDLACTITNTYDDNGGGGNPTPDTGTITVVKVVENGEYGTATVSDFDLYVDQTEVVSGASRQFNTGTYTVSENDGGTGILNDYTTAFSGDCDSYGNMTLAKDQALTCTITNTYQYIEPSLTVTLEIINDDGMSLSEEDFEVYVDETQIETDVATGFDPGDYTIDEDYVGSGLSIAAVTYSYSYSAHFSGDCDSNGNITMAPGNSYNVTITINDRVSQTSSGGGGPLRVPPETDEPADEPVEEPEVVEDLPEPRVLGTSDEVIEEEIIEEEPEPAVLGDVAELPRTGMPVLWTVIPLAGMIWASTRRKKK